MPYKLRTEHEKSFRDTGSGALFLTPTESIFYLLAFSNRKQVLTHRCLSFGVGNLLKSKWNFNTAVLGDFPATLSVYNTSCITIEKS